ncbi:hypothetical protein HG535_0G01770 [Zygotorulaspora mrakii]|uniref:Cytochrome b5 heme-binding domain-containing protein n=1 Tax=Zygotorulaspora mrakii TaxID=42260 RepID=A0A7H9B713_ZYGMR|nr:uncharacterized protein HG535_0G01770 [Zygotorulaspora mrakii]QLG74293.1 hypothetical protein HG535_0G01770 [Zygotorulaspora mrakii]
MLTTHRLKQIALVLLLSLLCNGFWKLEEMLRCHPTGHYTISWWQKISPLERVVWFLRDQIEGYD